MWPETGWRLWQCCKTASVFFAVGFGLGASKTIRPEAVAIDHSIQRSSIHFEDFCSARHIAFDSSDHAFDILGFDLFQGNQLLVVSRLFLNRSYVRRKILDVQN